MGILNKTNFLVIGPMQYSNGEDIREYFTQELGLMGVRVFDHYHKPFIYSVDEGHDLHVKLKSWMETEQYDKVASYKRIRLEDLNLVDRSDAIIFHCIPNVMTVGSWEEFFWGATRLKKPSFFIMEGGKRLTPFWVLWTIPHKYIYGSKEEVLDMIRKIDSGEIPIDSARWRLLKPGLR